MGLIAAGGAGAGPPSPTAGGGGGSPGGGEEGEWGEGDGGGGGPRKGLSADEEGKLRRALADAIRVRLPPSCFITSYPPVYLSLCLLSYVLRRSQEGGQAACGCHPKMRHYPATDPKMRHYPATDPKMRHYPATDRSSLPTFPCDHRLVYPRLGLGCGCDPYLSSRPPPPSPPPLPTKDG